MATEKGVKSYFLCFFLVLLTFEVLLTPVQGRKLGEVSNHTSKSSQDIRKPDCVYTPTPSTPFAPGTPSTPTTPGTPSMPYTPTPLVPVTPSTPSTPGYTPPGSTPHHGHHGSTPSHGNTPSHGTPSHGSTPSHGGTPSNPSHGGYYNTPTMPVITPPSSHGSTPSHGGTPSTPSHGGGGYYNTPTMPVITPPSSPYTPIPLVPNTPTPLLPVTPTPLVPFTPSPPSFPVLPTPTTPVPFDPNTIFPGTCYFWSTHPMLIWGLLGYWGTMGGAFSPLATTSFGQELSFPEALSNTRTDGIGALYREGTAALLNSMVDNKFPFTTQQVRDAFLSSLHSNHAAAAQALVFKKANEGHHKHN